MLKKLLKKGKFLNAGYQVIEFYKYYKIYEYFLQRNNQKLLVSILPMKISQKQWKKDLQQIWNWDMALEREVGAQNVMNTKLLYKESQQKQN